MFQAERLYVRPRRAKSETGVIVAMIPRAKARGHRVPVYDATKSEGYLGQAGLEGRST